MILKIGRLLLRYGLFIEDVFLDAFYYFNYSTLKIRKNNNENLSAEILAHVHSVERAFSLKNPRETFGVELINSLRKLIHKIDDKSKYQYELKIFQSAIIEYNKYHNIKEDNISARKPFKYYRHIKSNHKSLYESIVKDRHSIRNFGDVTISNLSVLKAITMAKNISPSVCNRQGWEIVLVKDYQSVTDVLNLQNGNAGIENIQNIIVVCSTITSFFGSNERNQPYVDGGIFLMSLLNSLHYYNVASCTLNWAVDRKQDSKLKKLLDIDNSRLIIALVGLGSYNTKEIKIASSYKKPLKSILKIVG
ncbi:MAG: nitroreductase family protein [Actinomycetia bacterium]|nr:nitroreductase family protein [Actinomycetes bacterium]